MEPKNALKYLELYDEKILKHVFFSREMHWQPSCCHSRRVIAARAGWWGEIEALTCVWGIEAPWWCGFSVGFNSPPPPPLPLARCRPMKHSLSMTFLFLFLLFVIFNKKWVCWLRKSPQIPWLWYQTRHWSSKVNKNWKILKSLDREKQFGIKDIP